MKLIFQIIASLGFINLVVVPVALAFFVFAPQIAISILILIPIINFIDKIFGVSDKKRKRINGEFESRQKEKDEIYDLYQNDCRKKQLEQELKLAHEKFVAANIAYNDNPTEAIIKEMFEADKNYSNKSDEVDEYYKEFMGEHAL